MRNITAEAVNAFKNPGKGMSKDNTVVMSDEAVAKLFLHGSLIAQLDRTGTPNILKIDNHGFYTNVTKERLNGILAAYGLSGIYQKAGKWYFDGGALFDGAAEFEVRG